MANAKFGIKFVRLEGESLSSFLNVSVFTDESESFFFYFDSVVWGEIFFWMLACQPFAYTSMPEKIKTTDHIRFFPFHMHT